MYVMAILAFGRVNCCDADSEIQLCRRDFECNMKFSFQSIEAMFILVGVMQIPMSHLSEFFSPAYETYLFYLE